MNPLATDASSNSSSLLTVPALKINFLSPEGHKTSASILSNDVASGSPSVSFCLSLVNIGQPAQPIIEIRKVVSVSEDGTAEATFSDIPALPMIATIEMSNCSKGGHNKYRGGIDLIANRVNTVDVSPTDSLMAQDVIAELMTRLAARSDTFELLGLNLANRAGIAMSGLDFSSGDAFETAINKFKNYSQVADSSVTNIDASAIVEDPNSGAQILGNEVIVTFKNSPTLQDIQLAQAQIGGTLAGSYPEIRTYRFLVNESLPSNAIVSTVESLQRDASINQFCYNVGTHNILQTTSLPDDPDYANNWGLEKIGAYESWTMLPSQGVSVAVLDTGILSSHEDLQANIDFANSINFTSDDSSNFEDGHSHGSHVAGIIASTINNARGTVGVSPNASIVAVKVLGDNGSGSSLNISLGIMHAANISNVRVINMSLGGKGTIPRDMVAAIDYAVSHDKLVVVAAGNSNDDATYYFPAQYAKCFTVAATSSDDSRATFSNYGAPVDISAPGVSIYAPVIGGSSNYDYKSGTSMATPFVSGLAAAIFSMRPEMSADNVQQLIKSSADSIAVDKAIGPRINMKNALENLPVKPINPPVLVLSVPEFLNSGAIADFIAVATDPQASSLTFEWTINSGSYIVKETQNFKSIITWNAPETEGWYEVACRVKNSNGGETQQSVAVYVVAAIHSYRVVYNGNGSTAGEVPVDSSSYVEGANVIVKGNTGSIVRIGYEFGGWNTREDGTGLNYSADNTFFMGSSHLTLYAKWIPTFNVGPGKIYGRLLDQNSDEPISGALIGIAGTSYYQITDNTGYFEFLNLQSGSYDLVVSRDGFQGKTFPGIVVP